MRILAAPDLHCWPSAYDRPGPDGRSLRLAEWERAADALVTIARREQVAAALFPGDLFPTARPSHQAVLAVARLFRRLEQAGVTVVAQYGNHDQPASDQPGPLDLLADLPERPWWGLRQPDVIPIGEWRVLALPWGRLTNGSADPAVRAQETSGRLVEIVRFFVEGLRSPVLVLAHWALAGAVWEGAGLTEPVLDVRALPESVRVVVAGHIHRPQVVQKSPVLALHTGALLRNDIGEADHERGCYVIDLDADPPEAVWHPVPAVRMHTYRWEVTSPDDLAHLRAFRPEGTLDGTFARVIVQTPEEYARQIDAQALARAIEAAGGVAIGVQVDVVQGQRARTNLTEATDPETALRTWLALRPELSDAIRARVLETVRPWLEEEVSGAGAPAFGA